MRCLALPLLAAAACASQDERDQASLRRLCDLPENAPVQAWRGFPATSGFGQREGLSLEGAFGVSASPGPEHGYLAGPLSETERRAAESLLGPLGPQDTVTAHRCATAGDDVLRATRLRPCDTEARALDIVLCLFDGASHTVRVRVRSAY